MGLSIIKVNPQSFCPCSEDMIETAQKVAKADSNMEISIYIYEHMAAYMDVKAAQTWFLQLNFSISFLSAFLHSLSSSL